MCALIVEESDKPRGVVKLTGMLLTQNLEKRKRKDIENFTESMVGN